MILLNSCKDTITENIAYNYPKIEKQSVKEEYCGIEITDDYRNLENLKDSSVINWFKEQEKFTKNFLNKINGRDELFDRMKGYASKNEFETYFIRVLTNGNYFYLKHYAEDNAPKLYMKRSLKNDDEILFDPKDYEKGNDENFTIRSYAPSWDGKKVAIALTSGGREFSEILIIDVLSKKILVEGIPNFWGNLTWLPDNRGIAFMALADNFEKSADHFKNMNVSIYKLGLPASKKEIVLSKEVNPELHMTVSDIPVANFHNQTDKYIITDISGATAYADHYYCLSSNFFEQKEINWKPLAKKNDKIKKIRIYNDSIFALTAINNESFEIVTKGLKNIDWNKIKVIVTPKEGEVIDDFEITSKGIFFTTLLNGVKAKLYKFKNGNVTEVNLPIDAGYASISNLSPYHSELWLITMGWLNNYERFKYQPENEDFLSEEISPVADYPEFENFSVKEVEVTAHDGEKIPLSIIHNGKIKKNGENPTLMIAYGSYGISYEPFFNTDWLTWVEYGGVLAIAHVRGGGEKGNTWYEGGKKESKPNTWKDMISCTEFMIEKNYTSKNRTIVRGGSAGGIMAGRSITERPDLFAVAMIRVGVLNALRNEDGPNGDNNVKEFGSYKNPEECLALLEMDSYTKIEKGVDYPATIITAGLNDPRVVSWSPGKFAARLQELSTSNNPILFYVQSDGGHGFDAGKWKAIKEEANLFAFAFWQVGHPNFVLTH
ncbi:hypothetical protein BFP77_15830 [Maribacter sp. 4U21]|nr:hypothetical protein BFP77_15830 [Maribacter sp. 4U21]